MASRVFEDAVLPHLDAAYNYARWLTKNHAEAEDVVQDACVRAMRFLSSLRDDDARALAVRDRSQYLVQPGFAPVEREGGDVARCRTA